MKDCLSQDDDDDYYYDDDGGGGDNDDQDGDNDYDYDDYDDYDDDDGDHGNDPNLSLSNQMNGMAPLCTTEMVLVLVCEPGLCGCALFDDFGTSLLESLAHIYIYIYLHIHIDINSGTQCMVYLPPRAL